MAAGFTPALKQCELVEKHWGKTVKREYLEILVGNWILL